MRNWLHPEMKIPVDRYFEQCTKFVIQAQVSQTIYAMATND